MKTYRLKLIIIAFFGIFLINQVYPQSHSSDTSFHPYHVNYWVTGGICGVGLLTNYLGLQNSLTKDSITLKEIDGLNKDIINSFDQWALKQDPSQRVVFENYSAYTMPVILLPALLMFDKQIRNDWLDLLLIYMEINTVTADLYEWSFLGPEFQNRFRPMVYYGSPVYGKSDSLNYDQRNSGNNRNSFYSGHVAFVAASTFFMAKVYSDYNPGIGNNKYLLYGAATIPPLILGYFRVKALRHFPSDVLVGLGVGALCGIIIPELHRLQGKDFTLGLFSSPEATGIAVNWQLNLLK